VPLQEYPLPKKSAPQKKSAKAELAKPPKPPAPTALSINIYIPKELGLTQDLVDKYKDHFMVEVSGTLGTQTPRVMICPIDTPTNDY
jgi:hypothetical protein